MADSSKKMQIVFASAECAPFVKTGGLGDVAGSLPAALVRAGAEVIVMVPKYATIKDEYKAQMEHFSDFYVSLGWRNEYCGLEKLEHDGVTYMFVDNERYFARDYPYGFFDDGERFAFFSSSSLTPNGASLSHTILRTMSSFSPTPAVKVITSQPPIW